MTPRTLNELAAAINDNARAHGFWEADRNFGELLMLATSELAEAMEEHRDGRPNLYYTHAKCPAGNHPMEGRGSVAEPYRLSITPTCKPEGVAVELADCLIRVLDTMHSLGVDIDAIVTEKMAYNASRPYVGSTPRWASGGRVRGVISTTASTAATGHWLGDHLMRFPDAARQDAPETEPQEDS